MRSEPGVSLAVLAAHRPAALGGLGTGAGEVGGLLAPRGPGAGGGWGGPRAAPARGGRGRRFRGGKTTTPRLRRGVGGWNPPPPGARFRDGGGEVFFPRLRPPPLHFFAI